MKLDNEDSSRLEGKLDTLIRLIALNITLDISSIKDKAILLSKAGLQIKEIAMLCDSTPNAVSVALYKAKKNTGRVKALDIEDAA
ncbi:MULTISPECIES: hypothetical protein [Rhodomicrobium]|uniref:hypothetical protein n=1 Tax=Rhodomicrobium TaxID=1068 RepID=UPI000B4BE3DE|nr:MULTISPECIES: hypothetical protein [Rhodomicrobium]